MWRSALLAAFAITNATVFRGRARPRRGYLGRLDPTTGAVREWPSPGDPATQRFQTWTIPSGGDVVRNMSPFADGNIAIACSGANRVGLVEIR
jgi:virginiamycin B lyase